MTTISSLQNPRLKKYRQLKQKKYRDQSGYFLVEGYHLLQEAQKAKCVVEVLSADLQVAGIPVTMAIIKKLASVENPQPVIALCQKKTFKLKGQKILLLDHVQDPGNVGTLIRSAKAFNYDGIILFNCVDPYNPKVIRATQGALWQIPFVVINDQKQLIALISKLALPLVGALLNKNALRAQNICFWKLILVIGNEGNGISSFLISKLDYQVYIPISFASLNAAVAGGILMYQYRNQ